MRRAGRLVRNLLLGLLLLVVLLLLPVGYVETFCRADADKPAATALITDPAFQRAEANTYLTYPEWHIVYAYEGLARVLETGDEHAFGYASSVKGFWTSFCALNREAGRHGGADFATRSTIHVIGVSFTLEMAMKALYEETLGHVFALLRGPVKTPQDRYAAAMAADYAAFLQQVPWYKYDFGAAVSKLWAEPMTAPLRGWERRLALGGEWKAKAVYARGIAAAVQASGEAKLSIRSVVTGLDPAVLSAIPEVRIVATLPQGIVIETPRYRKFTHIIEAVIAAGGSFVDIAGNDEIMLSATGSHDPASQDLTRGRVLSRIGRDGYDGERMLVGTRLEDLGPTVRELADHGLALEHIYDY